MIIIKQNLCEDIFSEGSFSDLNEFYLCERAIARALMKGVIKKIPEPDWFIIPEGEIGDAAFYECMDTGAIWNLVIPERASRGYWKRIV